jgi:hypothetical protein
MEEEDIDDLRKYLVEKATSILGDHSNDRLAVYVIAMIRHKDGKLGAVYGGRTWNVFPVPDDTVHDAVGAFIKVIGAAVEETA